MASVRNYLGILTFLLLHFTFMIVHCHHDEDHTLFENINTYRTSLNLTALTENKQAECFAEGISDSYKDKSCTNTSVSNTVLPQFKDFPAVLSECKLNISNTRDGIALPACVPGLVPSQVLSNFTQSVYARFLNDSTYVGVGIASENDWMIVVLTTNTEGGNFGATSNVTTPNSAGMVSKVGFFQWAILVFGSIYLVFH